MKTKEELLKIALSGKSNRPYKISFGFDEADKFLKAFGIFPSKDARHIPSKIVYYFYYLWVKEDNAKNKPETFRSFCRKLCKYTKSISYANTKSYIYFKAYKLKNFPDYNVEDELQARRIIDEQAKSIKAKKERRKSKKKVLQSKG